MPRPNILVILTDQQRWDCVGYAGNEQIQTPHLDRLAEDGVSYSNSFCPYPVCTPSRYSLLSGLSVHQHGGWSNRATLAPGIATFPRLLRENGYRNRAVGKMHFNPTYLDVGFSQMQLAEQNGEGRFDDDYHRDLMAHGLVDANDLFDQRAEFRRLAPPSYWENCGAQTSNLPEEWHSTTWIAERAMDALGEWTEGDNLLMVGFVKPHHPFDPPSPWAEMYDPNQLALLPGWTNETPPHDLEYSRGYFPHDELNEGKLRHVMAHYYASINQIDHQVGRMIEHLHQRGLYENTLIIFTSDHGEYMGFHHMILKSGLMYDPIVRVPLLIKFPGNVAAGAARETLVSNIDLAPTILRQAQVEPALEMRGLNLFDSARARHMLFAESHDGNRYMMARSLTHKLLLSRDGKQNYFFDLRDDPHELRNRFADSACVELVQKHYEGLAAWMMLDALTPLYQDLQAPSILPNHPLGEEVRSKRKNYYETQMAALLPD